MTKSSTLVQCVESGKLKSLSAGLLDADEVQKVWVYGTPEYENWQRETLPTLPSLNENDVSPLEEVQMFLRVLMLRKRASCQLQRMQPTKQGIFEVRLPQIRLFGWFVQPCNLVLTSGVEIAKVKVPRGYDPHFLNAREIRARLKLDYVGGDIRNVLSEISGD